MFEKWWPSATEYTEFLSPGALISGSGSANKLSAVLKSHLHLQAGPVLVAVDDAVLNAGLVEKTLEELGDNGYEVTLCSGFGAEPNSETLDVAAEKARDAGAQAVIGIGGGSVLDSSKMLSLLIRNDGGAVDWLGAVEPSRPVVPMVLVPTTCGTGSEATRISMVTVNRAKRASSCAQYVPSVAVLDPDMVVSLPAGVVASTGMDALAHAAESVMSTISSPMSVHHALRAVDLLIANLEPAVEGDVDARANCLWASHLAGQALNAGVVLGHSLAYCVANEVGMPHGTSCALTLPYCLAYNQNIEAGRAAALARSITAGASDQLTTAAEQVMNLAVRLGLPVTLDDAGTPAGAEASLAHQCVTEYPRPTNPEPLDETRLAELLAAMRTGNLQEAFAVTGVTACR